jgi:hypothetical protein
MALPILDGNQSATTLSSILTSGEHIPAHTVVSLGTQAITDISGAVSGSVVSISNFPATQPVSIASVTIGNTVTIAGTVTANPTGTQTIAGTVTANISAVYAGEASFTQADNPMMAVGGLLQGFNEIRPITIDLNTGGQIVAGTVTANLSQIAFTNTEGGIASDDGGEEPNLGIQLGYYDGDYKTVKPSQPPGTVTANVGSILGFNEIYLADADNDTRFSSSYPFPISGTVTVGNSVTIASLPAISGTVTANASFASTTATYPSQIVAIGYKDEINTGNITPVTNDGDGGLPVFLGGISVEGNNNAILPTWLDGQEALNVPIAGTVTIGNSVTIASLPAISGTVTANVGSILGFNEIYLADADNDTRFSSSYPFPISGTVTVGNSVTIGSLPAISGTVTANTFALQGTAVTTSNFTSTTASTVLANFNATREVLTIFNEGAGNLHICAGATCTTIAYQVRLSAGDYYEVPNHQTTITHSAVFATAGTARVTEVS